MYLYDPGDVVGVEGYDQFVPNEWPSSGRYTSVNGLVLPTFTGARSGMIERWRVIHGGVRATINHQFRKLRPNAPGLQGLGAPACAMPVWKAAGVRDPADCGCASSAPAVRMAAGIRSPAPVLRSPPRSGLLLKRCSMWPS